jgi:clan AA aspartic protease
MGLVYVTVRLRRPGSATDYADTFLVDTGATDSMAPSARLLQAGIRPIGRHTYEHADGSRHEYRFGLAEIEVLGEVTAGRVLFGPDDAEPLLGVTALESMGMTVDPANQVPKRLPAIPLK